jgi:hypothetical protein
MKFQSSMRHLPSLVLLAAVAVTCPAAAQERVAEPPPGLRDAKTSDAPASGVAKEVAPESPPKSRDAKAVDVRRSAVDWKAEAIRKDLRIPAEPREGDATRESPASSCKDDCEKKLPAGANPSTSGQVIETPREQAPEAILQAEPDLTASEEAASRRRLGQALGAGGVVAAVAGTYLVVATIVARPETHGEFATGRTEFLVAGLAGIGVGAGLMIGGFSLAAANRPESVGLERVPAVAERRSLRETGISLTGRF